MAKGRKKQKLVERNKQNVIEFKDINISNANEDTIESNPNNDVAVDPFLEVSLSPSGLNSSSETNQKRNVFHFLHTEANFNEPCPSSISSLRETNENRDLVQGLMKSSTSVEDKKLLRTERKSAKKKRETGNCYLGYRRVGKTVKQDVPRPARTLRITCLSKLCRKSALKHCNMFTEEERSRIFKCFWRMNWTQKVMYVCNLVKIIAKKTSSSETSRRSESRQYFLIKSDNQEYRVCQKMFFNTLSINEKMVRIWLKSKLDFGFFEHPDDIREKIMVKRRQGEKYQENQRRKEYLKNFLMKFPKLESHYCRKDTTKEYLQTEHRTLTDVYKDYVQFSKQDNIKELSITVFSKMFKSLNYSLFKPRKDQCDDCIAYKVGNLSEGEFQTHRQKIHSARAEKEKDISDAINKLITLLCMDVEAVQLCPKLNASALYFKLKMQMHNFTIYDILSHRSSNYVWDETEGELKASIFASIIIYHLEALILKNSCRDTVVIYSDGCGYQNRNAVLSNALSNFATKHDVTIVQKYLVKGHTQMECDSTHALIERKTKGKTINLPKDFVDAITQARKKPFPLEVKQLTHDFFLNYDDPSVMFYDSIRPGVTVGDPCVNDLRALKYTSDGNISYKLSFEENWKNLPHKPNHLQTSPPENIYHAKIPISYKKFQHLQELKLVLPSDAHHYYDSLPHEPKKPVNKNNAK